jgi:hypothetical protein
MNYNSHKDQKLISEAYLKVKQKNDVVVEFVDPTQVAANLVKFGAKTLYKGTKALVKAPFKVYDWAKGWSEENKKSYKEIERKYNRSPLSKKQNKTLKDILLFLINHKKYATDYVYDTLFAEYRENPDMTATDFYRKHNIPIPKAPRQSINVPGVINTGQPLIKNPFRDPLGPIGYIFKEVATEVAKGDIMGDQDYKEIVNTLRPGPATGPTPGPTPPDNSEYADNY